MGSLVGVDEAAELHKTSPKTIEKLILDGEISAFQIRSELTGLLDWRISVEQLEEFFAHRESGFGKQEVQ